ncbi:MAG: hypothetical protein WBO46_18995 [Caldilineaceae bacterium]
MAWQAPPTFTDTTLSAAQLNILSDDVEYLYGLSSAVNMPFLRDPAFQGGNNTTSYWQIRHRAQYLNAYIGYTVDAGWIDHLAWTVTYGGTTLSSTDPIAYTSPGYVAFDLDALGSFTLGNWYEITIAVRGHNAGHAVQTTFGSTEFFVYRLFESDTDYS